MRAAIGFDADVTSANRTSVAAAQAAPTDGRPDIPLTFTLRVTRADGSLVAVPVVVGSRRPPIRRPSTTRRRPISSRTSRRASKTQPRRRGSRRRRSPSPTSATTLVSSRRPTDNLLAFTIDGGASLGFTTTTASVRQGDLVYFSAYDGSTGNLWVTDGTPAGTHIVTGGAATNPSQLTVVGDAVYFTAADNARSPRR